MLGSALLFTTTPRTTRNVLPEEYNFPDNFRYYFQIPVPYGIPGYHSKASVPRPTGICKVGVAGPLECGGYMSLNPLTSCVKALNSAVSLWVSLSLAFDSCSMPFSASTCCSADMPTN